MVRVLLAAFLACGVVACKMTPEEIEAIETENELLRTQIQVMRQKCEYYRVLELEREGEAREPE